MLKASALKFNETKRLAIQKEIKHILAYIDDEISKAHEGDKREANVLLPIQFSIPNVSNANAQRIIYSEVLLSLLGREFHVEIEITKDKALFDITWYSREELEQIDRQTKLIAKHSKKSSLNKDLNE